MRILQRFCPQARRPAGRPAKPQVRRSVPAARPSRRSQLSDFLAGWAAFSGRRSAAAAARTRRGARRGCRCGRGRRKTAAGALAAFCGFDQNPERISFRKRLFDRSVAAFFGFDQMSAIHLVKTEKTCQPRAEKRGPRCETAHQLGQNRKKLPRPFYRLAREGRASRTGGRPARRRCGRSDGTPRRRGPTETDAPERKGLARTAPRRRGAGGWRAADGHASRTGAQARAGARTGRHRPGASTKGGPQRPARPPPDKPGKRKRAPSGASSGGAWRADGRGRGAPGADRTQRCSFEAFASLHAHPTHTDALSHFQPPRSCDRRTTVPPEKP